LNDTEKENEIISDLIRWAEHQPLIRAVLITSSRAIPDAPIDIFSDYDVILAVLDVQSFHEDRTWLDTFGSVLVIYRDPLEPYYGFKKSGYVTQYENGLKIDFTLWSVEILQKVATQPHDELSSPNTAGTRREKCKVWLT
jgi:aminoglycoside 6-adenylyltransferase